MLASFRAYHADRICGAAATEGRMSRGALTITFHIDVFLSCALLKQVHDQGIRAGMLASFCAYHADRICGAAATEGLPSRGALAPS